ncbi:MAG: helix-turn-helix transcriptional regulator [Candidatus Binatus sp.]|jgi:transcriptional regulator with XRE-family HTH domain
MGRSLHSERYKHLLARLREARRQVELTQVEVARRLRRPQSYVSKCESGERRIDVIELAEFANLYGKSIEFFVR